MIYKSSYSENNLSFEYSFEDEGCYFAKVYVRSENGRYRTSAIVAAITSKENGIFDDTTNDFPYLNLIYRSQSVERVSMNKYIFHIDFDYSWNRHDI